VVSPRHLPWHARQPLLGDGRRGGQPGATLGCRRRSGPRAASRFCADLRQRLVPVPAHRPVGSQGRNRVPHSAGIRSASGSRFRTIPRSMARSPSGGCSAASSMVATSPSAAPATPHAILIAHPPSRARWIAHRRGVAAARRAGQCGMGNRAHRSWSVRPTAGPRTAWNTSLPMPPPPSAGSLPQYKLGSNVARLLDSLPAGASLRPRHAPTAPREVAYIGRRATRRMLAEATTMFLEKSRAKACCSTAATALPAVSMARPTCGSAAAAPSAKARAAAGCGSTSWNRLRPDRRADSENAKRCSGSASIAGPVTPACGCGDNRSWPGIRIREDPTATGWPDGNQPDIHLPSRQGRAI